MMCSSALEGKTRVMVSLAIFTKLFVTREFTLSSMMTSLREERK